MCGSSIFEIVVNIYNISVPKMRCVVWRTYTTPPRYVDVGCPSRVVGVVGVVGVVDDIEAVRVVERPAGE